MLDTHDENSSVRLFFQIIRLCFTRNFALCRSINLHPGQIHLLTLLDEREGVTQKELSDHLYVSAPTVAVTLRRLESAGLVDRRKDPEDHRKFRIFLTESGRRTARQLSQITDQMRGVFTKNFSPEEQMLFKRLLLQVRENLLESDDKNRSLSQEKAPDEKISF